MHYLYSIQTLKFEHESDYGKKYKVVKICVIRICVHVRACVSILKK
ncbi:hypothetical protein PBCV1_a395bL [Paramecium bursaria Chlorella virus 1]|uniref:Uncharacterized protein n=1 Tax=Paramecium bursaria Chlorella virus 1 TaxID=10506 RepID=F8TU32_PBCV1|nr:hypothetical protein PBCV1_a395bL [Paramecium bursaria Chlorella virus 1]AEI70093.1 hypothetical protein [Paramecium bursaria Chlorella virus 1]